MNTDTPEHRADGRAPALGRIAIALVTGWDIAKIPPELPDELATFEASVAVVGRHGAPRSLACRRPLPRSHRGEVLNRC